MKSFCADKNKEENVFEEVSYQRLNDYLREKPYEITSKVLRTYKASRLFEETLLKSNQNNSTAYEEARKAVQKQLKHKHIVSGMSYIDPRILLAW